MMYLIVRRFRPTNFSGRDDNAGFLHGKLTDCRPTQNEPGKVGFSQRATERVITQYASCASPNTINHCCFFDLRLRDTLCTTSARIFYSRCPWPGTHCPAGNTRRTWLYTFFSINFFVFFPFKFNPVLFAAHITVIYHILICVCVCVCMRFCNKLRSINDNNSDVILKSDTGSFLENHPDIDNARIRFSPRFRLINTCVCCLQTTTIFTHSPDFSTPWCISNRTLSNGLKVKIVIRLATKHYVKFYSKLLSCPNL